MLNGWMSVSGSAYLPGYHADRLRVHRVNWLRQKAVTDRWDEQYILVGEEMKQTVRSFEHRVQMWKRLCQGSNGRRAYARRQAFVWQSLADDARAEFQKYIALE